MPDRVLIPLPGVGTLDLAREVYEAALRPIAAPSPPTPDTGNAELVTARALAHQMSLPVSCLYEYAKAGHIPSVRVGKHVRFNAAQEVAALRKTGGVTVGRQNGS